MSLKQFLKDFIKKVKPIEKIKSIGIVVISDGEVLTSYYNATLEQKQLMASHIQIDVVDQLILVNKDRYRIGD